VKILVADDEGATRLKLETLLAKLGYEVILAHDGAEAWEVLQREDAPTLAIIDWIMPGIDGVEVCRRVRMSGKRPYVYLIMLTVKDEKQDLVAGMEAGADDYLSKPFDLDELRVRLRAGERILALQDELRAQATHDDLTGVLNRGTILEIVQRELAHVTRKGESAGIILADLDNFKQINDTYGHPIGDEVLRESSRRLGARMRSYDAIGRYGGEEFLVVLPGCGRGCALEVAERMRFSVADQPIVTPAGEVGITVSLGVTVVEKGHTLKLDTVIVAADQALYRAKRAGRNRVEGPLK
jgi:two-component system cell cycle response regulator